MSSSRFLQTFIFTLILPLPADAAAPGVQMRLSRDAHAPYYLTDSKKLSKTPGGPGRLEKFILKPVENPAPAHADAADHQAVGEPEAAPPIDNSSTSDELNLSIPAQPLLSRSSRRLTLIDKAYLDVYTILQESNSCSRFFGGPRIATDILNVLYPRLKTALLDSHVGISMSGPVTSVTDAQTGARYRLFKKALVNLTGPFYRNASDRLQRFFHKIGPFSPNTRKARASMLLHELGHLLPGSDGRWLLADDGSDQVQVDANTSMIMDRCNEQIKALSR